jgi:phenylalanyl-tRNA synthetase alpha chain
MEKNTPPFQIIVPGRTFRFEAVDAGHETNFHQLEGLMVGKDITLANFKFVVEEFFKRFFAGQDIEFRYRPSYFPFVEPGVEVDIKLGGKWLEMGGAGMVHPRVFEYAHYNPREWRGFAYGFGIDRLARIKYGIPDVRLFFSGDLRFIKQF